MAALTADFELGTNGATIATGDTGSATAWNAISGTPTYDTTHPAHGTKGANCNTSASFRHMDWFPSSLTTSFGRAYMYATSAPSSDDRCFEFRNSNNPITRLIFRTTGNSTKIMLQNNAGSNLGITTTSYPLNALFRIEWKNVYDTGGAGIFELKLFLTADSITADETKTATSLTSAFSNETQFLIGSGLAGTNTFPVWYDQIVEGASAYPGPFPVNTTAPTISGSAPVGSVLTAGNGTWNSGATFNYTYQWTTGGSNIGGATSATYTTVSGDAGNAIGCKVTATGQQATNENATQASSNTITPTAVSGVSLLGSPPTDFFFFP